MYRSTLRKHLHRPGYGHPEYRLEEILRQRVPRHGHRALPAHCQDLKSRINQIRLLDPMWGPVPF